MSHISYLIVAGLAALATATTAIGQPSRTPQDSNPASGHSRRMNIDSYTLLGQIALEEGRKTDAVQALLKATTLSDNTQLAAKTASLAYQLGLTEAGIKAVQHWQSLQPDDARARWFLGVFDLRQGHVDKATAEFTSYVHAADNAGRSLSIVADALTAEQNAAAATTVMQALVQRFPHTNVGDYALAQLALRSGNTALAVTHAREAVDLRPGWLPAKLLYASALLTAGHTEQSVTYMQQLADKTDTVPVQLQYAETLLAAGQTEAGHALLDKIQTKHPALPEADRAIAFLALSENKLDKASNLFSSLRSKKRFRNEAFYYLGRIAEQRDEPLKATRSYARVTDGSHAVEAQLRAARVMLEQLQNGDAALAHLQQFGQANPRYKTSMSILRAQLLVRMKRPDDAVSLMRTTSAQHPENSTLQNADAQLYVTLSQQAGDQGAYDQAEAYLADGLTRHPGQRNLRYAKALLLQQRGQPQASEQVLQSLVNDFPDDPAVLNALGYLLTDELGHHEKARTYIQKALDKAPDNPAIIDSMGWVLYHLGDYQAALDYLERAYKLFPDPEVAAHLINTQWALGNKDKAIALLHSALKESPNDAGLKALDKRLAQ